MANLFDNHRIKNKELIKQNDKEANLEIEDKIKPVNKIPYTMLSLTLEQKLKYSDEYIKELQKILESLPPLEVGEVNIYPVEAGNSNDGYYVNVFIRNGGDLLLDLSINAISMSLFDSSGDKVAFGIFKPLNFQSLKFGESRFWTFIWKKEDVIKKGADLSRFRIDFE